MIPGVCQRKGLTYRRFRVKRKGRDGKVKWTDQYIRLPDPTDPEFATELARVNKTPQPCRVAAKGSIAALVVEFRAALANGWTRKRRKTKRKGEPAKPLAPSTIANYNRYIDLIEIEHGHRIVADLRPKHVFTIRDGMADEPGKANNYLTVFKLIMWFATERDWRGDNPADKIPLLPIGEHEPWPAEVIEAALAKASPMIRLSIVTGLCSGQRISDCIQMMHSWHDMAIMELDQQKTARAAAIPMHPLWLAEIGGIPKKSVTILYGRGGRPFSSPDAIQSALRRLMLEIGHVGYTFHGLRKNACCYLLELGLSDTEVGAILGMDPETVRHYGKRARVLMIVRGTAERVTRGNVLHIRGNSAAGGEK